MAGYNRVILMGNLTADPELRYTPQGTAVADLRLAVNSTRGRGSDKKEDVVYIDVTVWERQAETCCEYLSKGRQVLVEGRLRMEQWEDRDTGKKRSKISVTAQSVNFVGGGGEGGGGGRRYGNDEGGSGGGQRRGGEGGGRSEAPRRQEDNLDNDFEANDDVPF